jgi:ribosomal protein S6--L-glutamate ligase
MAMRIGIITVRDSAYHPNRRLLEAAGRAGHQGALIHPYRLWPAMVNGEVGLVGENAAHLPHVVLPRQGAQIGDACLALVGQFQKMGVPLVNGFEAVATARNKFLTQQVLTAAALPCPDTVFVNDAAGVLQAADRLGGYPIVVKPVSARQGTGVLRIENVDDCRRRAMEALNRQQGLMIQCYLPPEKRLDVRALVVGGEVLCAAALVPPPGEFRANFHLGADIRPTVLSTDLERTALAAAAAVGCGVAGVDMMVDGDGRPLIVEVNYSPGFKGMEAASGLDIAGRIVAFAVERYQQASR